MIAKPAGTAAIVARRDNRCHVRKVPFVECSVSVDRVWLVNVRHPVSGSFDANLLRSMLLLDCSPRVLVCWGDGKRVVLEAPASYGRVSNRDVRHVMKKVRVSFRFMRQSLAVTKKGCCEFNLSIYFAVVYANSSHERRQEDVGAIQSLLRSEGEWTDSIPHSSSHLRKGYKRSQHAQIVAFYADISLVPRRAPS